MIFVESIAVKKKYNCFYDKHFTQVPPCQQQFLQPPNKPFLKEISAVDSTHRSVAHILIFKRLDALKILDYIHCLYHEFSLNSEIMAFILSRLSSKTNLPTFSFRSP